MNGPLYHMYGMGIAYCFDGPYVLYPLSTFKIRMSDGNNCKQSGCAE